MKIAVTVDTVIFGDLDRQENVYQRKSLLVFGFGIFNSHYGPKFKSILAVFAIWGPQQAEGRRVDQGPKDPGSKPRHDRSRRASAGSDRAVLQHRRGTQEGS